MIVTQTVEMIISPHYPWLSKKIILGGTQLKVLIVGDRNLSLAAALCRRQAQSPVPRQAPFPPIKGTLSEPGAKRNADAKAKWMGLRM